ncbi:Programmed cell death protein 4 [Cichlidogyrus casuarinus]|uniref:Programmed cell death protein 4 n=1 Tax=Cichlidogyrus casuarinus TaxID=1844966 RepID=A0ABD2Q9H9_9PLAT
MLEESVIELSAEDKAGDLPSFPEKPIRLKNRKHSSSFSHSGTNGLTVNGVPSSEERLAAAFHRVSLGNGINALPTDRKNSRKPRNGFNKATGKKFGSKDIWFRAHDEMDDYVMDRRDPEYDSNEEEDPIAFDFERPVIMSNAEFERVFVNLVQEFLEHVRPEEVLASLREMKITEGQKSSMAFYAISAAMPRQVARCELTSELLTFLARRFLTPQQLQQGFLKLLHELPELCIDLPRAPEYAGRFIARAMADGILPKNFLGEESILVSNITDALNTSHSPPISAPAFNGVKKNLRTYSGDQALSSGISSASDSLGASLNGSASTGMTPAFELSFEAQQAMKLAGNWLEEATNCAKFNTIWGKHCGLRATSDLIKHIQQILDEYMTTFDVAEVEKQLRSLDSPHFHHEFVYQAILTTVESGTDSGIERMVKLLKALCESVVVSHDQLCRGVKRVYAEMHLLQTETPLAYSLLNRFVERSVEAGFFSNKLAQERPPKARKRYVSEGESLHYRR